MDALVVMDMLVSVLGGLYLLILERLAVGVDVLDVLDVLVVCDVLVSVLFGPYLLVNGRRILS